MSINGVISEFNPFHNGHKYLLDVARADGAAVVCAMSGNFVQRGDVAIYNKSLRAHAALTAGADMVLEIPAVYSMSTAQNFAFCGISALANMGCDTVVFGSETGDTDRISATAEVLLSRNFKETLGKFKNDGSTFAVARHKAAVLCGADSEILLGANDNLGVEYMVASKRGGYTLDFKAVKRQGALHSGHSLGNFAPASHIRKLILSGKKSQAARYMPKESVFLLNEKPACIKYGEKAILALLRSKTREELACLPDISEGIENRLFEAVKVACSIEELYALMKTKRYTLSRVRRLVLCAALGFDGSFFLSDPPYIRILGSRKSSPVPPYPRSAVIPVINRVSQIDSLNPTAKKMFANECIAGDIYNLCFDTPLPCGGEYSMKYDFLSD